MNADRRYQAGIRLLAVLVLEIIRQVVEPERPSPISIEPNTEYVTTYERPAGHNQ